MHSLIGWRRAMDVVKTNLAGAARHATAKVRQWLAEKSRK
jgi:hypothetical protein